MREIVTLNAGGRFTLRRTYRGGHGIHGHRTEAFTAWWSFGLAGRNFLFFLVTAQDTFQLKDRHPCDDD